ncbi:hypothetical protein PUP68_21320 [Pseudomonas chlororaphis]|uniref:hypothetical protein n=1 Tax=Pseudomonas chlororaphis TaxID=587753 RepID=UPI002368F182|nr:hypothetical protein [Pseudomonas chlororaphis]WDG77383.1 hypothetical protein PUP77_23540 [Pseudomonas chlororaphis]WDG83378.1 hypothetical protein PUP68_21320 [Pseudomonas chlororaphis]
MHIDDTDDWLGIPTPLEIATQHGALLENEIQELTIQLRQARANIFKLVEMHTQASAERDRLKADLERTQTELSAANRLVVETELKYDWQLMAMNKHLAEITAEVKRLHGLEDYAPLPPIPPAH